MSNKSRVVLLLLLCSAIWLEVSESLEQKNNETAEKSAHPLSRRRKHRKHLRFVVPMVIAALLMKSVLFPLAFKAMATMSSISIVLSTMSLLVASIVGYMKLGSQSTSTSVKYHHHPEYRRHDMVKAETDNIFTPDYGSTGHVYP